MAPSRHQTLNRRSAAGAASSSNTGRGALALAVVAVGSMTAMVSGVLTGCGADEPAAVVAPLPVPPPPPPVPYPRPTYALLSETGLFTDQSMLIVNPEAVAFEPTYRLWSDAAVKRRWFRLPPGTQIDTTDMDHWVVPVGTKLWKEFSLGGVLLETRLVERYGDGPDDYWMGAFVWNDTQTEAALAPDGQDNIAGTPHDAPSQEKCGACHRGDVGRVMGLSAMQLSRPAGGTQIGPTIADLAAGGLLTIPPPAAAIPLQAPYAIPGDVTAMTALGYLHANCGHCHNENGAAWPDTQMVLRSRTADHDLLTSAVYQSIVAGRVQYWRGGAIHERVSPGNPAASAIIARMSVRGTDDQMPPIATEEVDADGLAAVSAWILSLPAAPTPAAGP